MRILLITLYLVASSCCVNLKNNQKIPNEDCINKAYNQYFTEISKTQEYYSAINAFRDTFSNWILANRSPASNFFDNSIVIEPDVLFNKKKDKCLILISGISNDNTAPLDLVKICAGELLDGSWSFYYRSYPVNYYFRKDNNGQPYNHSIITRKTITSLCYDGFIISDSCIINYSYVDSDIWFQDWMREKHKEFWNSGY